MSFGLTPYGLAPYGLATTGAAAPAPEPFATNEEAWAFVLDGHVFYVLFSSGGVSLVYDLSTGQWHGWATEALTFWNMRRGIMWKGRVIAADGRIADGATDPGPKIWELDPASMLDEGTLEIARVVSGFQPIRGRGSFRQGSLRLTATGTPSAGAVLKMRFSDDEGVTWSQEYSVALDPDATVQPIKFRSLGRLRAPGRLWEISDAGGVVCVMGMDSVMEE